MDDYYQLLDLKRSNTAAQITEWLEGQYEHFKLYANSQDETARNDATRKLELIGDALLHFASDDKRRAYDSKLSKVVVPVPRAADNDLHTVQTDVDLYQLLGLPMVVTVPQISQRAQTVALQPEQRQLVDTYLLDAQRRRVYDEYLSELRERRKQQGERPTVPIVVGNRSITAWRDLENALADHPNEALELLDTGHIVAWAEWAIGRNDYADRVRSLMPEVSLEHLLRAVNPDRPYRLDVGTDQPLILLQASDLIEHATQWHPQLAAVVTDLYDWLCRYRGLTVTIKFEIERSPRWHLEQLLDAIQPNHLPKSLPASEHAAYRMRTTLNSPHLSSDQVLDFGELKSWQTPKTTLTLRQQGKFYAWGLLRPSHDWIRLSQTHYEGDETMIEVTVDPQGLEGGDGKIIRYERGKGGTVIEYPIRATRKGFWGSLFG